MHSLTHSQTDRANYRMPPAPFFNGGEGMKRESVSEDCVKIVMKKYAY